MGNDEIDDQQQEQLDESAASISLSGWVTGVGFLHYLCLYQGFGHVTLTNGESFSWITYVEFLVTTPLMLVNMASLIHAPHSVRVQLIIFDILMISTGFIGASRDRLPASFFILTFKISFISFH